MRDGRSGVVVTLSVMERADLGGGRGELRDKARRLPQAATVPASEVYFYM